MEQVEQAVTRYVPRAVRTALSGLGHSPAGDALRPRQGPLGGAAGAAREALSSAGRWALQRLPPEVLAAGGGWVGGWVGIAGWGGEPPPSAAAPRLRLEVAPAAAAGGDGESAAEGVCAGDAGAEEGGGAGETCSAAAAMLRAVPVPTKGKGGGGRW